MPRSQRTKDKLIRDNQRFENHALAGILKILQRIEVFVAVESTVPRSICPHDGCLLFPSDNTCPQCQVRLVGESSGQD